MSNKAYTPGRADVAHVHKDGAVWQLVLVKELRHPPEKVWRALTEPEHLREWAPFDASDDLGKVGPVSLTWAGAAAPTESHVTHADFPRLLEYTAGEQTMRWEIRSHGGGTRLTLWAGIDRRFIALGAAGWHISLDVLEQLLDGRPIGRIAGPAAMQFDGWQRLRSDYSRQFALEVSEW